MVYCGNWEQTSERHFYEGSLKNFIYLFISAIKLYKMFYLFKNQNYFLLVPLDLLAE